MPWNKLPDLFCGFVEVANTLDQELDGTLARPRPSGISRRLPGDHSHFRPRTVGLFVDEVAPASVGAEGKDVPGDVGKSEKNRIRGYYPDILLTTPESLEVMFISARSEARDA